MSTSILARLIFFFFKILSVLKMFLFHELRCVATVIPWLSFWRLRAFKRESQTKWQVAPYVMSRAVTEQIVTQSCRLVEFTVWKWLKLTHFHLFTPLFDWKKQLCNGKTYKKYEKRAFRLQISTFVRFEIGSVYTITACLQWKFLNFDGVLHRFPLITQANSQVCFKWMSKCVI